MFTTGKLGLVLSLIVLLPTLGAETVFGDPVTSTNVSYTVSSNVSVGAGGPIGIAGNIDVTLECETSYSYLVEGQFPGTGACHLGVTPNSGTLTVDYHITRPALDGHKSTPLPAGGQELVGDSPPISIPIDSIGTIEIVIHGRLLGNLSVDSASRTSLEWSTWEIKNLNITANAPIKLSFSTEYVVSFTLTVSIAGFDAVSKDIPEKEALGNPSEFVIPEFPSLLILTLFMTLTTMLATTIRRRKRNARL